jgi:hypothetical protein
MTVADLLRRLAEVNPDTMIEFRADPVPAPVDVLEIHADGMLLRETILLDG